MCVPPKNRTLVDDLSTKIYEFFERNGLCANYVQNDEFLVFLNSQEDYRKFRLSKPYELKQMLTGLEFFLGTWKWKEDLGKLSTSLLSLLEVNNFFPEDYEPYKKPKKAFDVLCYYLEMIAFDYKEFIR